MAVEALREEEAKVAGARAAAAVEAAILMRREPLRYQDPSLCQLPTRAKRLEGEPPYEQTMRLSG